IEKMEEMGIPARGYFSPIHLQPYIREMFGTKEGMLPITEDISKRTLALPFHNNLKVEEIEEVARILREVIKACL
ncbi:MAG: DegT/DnrJ/EryC1/StrS family aminotransferase, partial [bacterium]